jgi:hypothetical protein
MSEPERGILVSMHAVDRYRRRNNIPREPLRQTEQRISDCIRLAISEGRIFNHKPNGFLLYGEKRKQLPSEQRFVQCDESYGFIIRRAPGEDIVLTMLSKAGVRR